MQSIIGEDLKLEMFGMGEDEIGKDDYHFNDMKENEF